MCKDTIKERFKRSFFNFSCFYSLNEFICDYMEIFQIKFKNLDFLYKGFCIIIILEFSNILLFYFFKFFREMILLDECKLISNIFKCLSHPIRLRIIKFLEEESLSVLELAEKLNASQSSISQHLKILEENGVILKEKKGNVVYCKLKHRLVLELLSDGKRIISQELNEAHKIIKRR